MTKLPTLRERLLADPGLWLESLAVVAERHHCSYDFVKVLKKSETKASRRPLGTASACAFAARRGSLLREHPMYGKLEFFSLPIEQVASMSGVCRDTILNHRRALRAAQGIVLPRGRPLNGAANHGVAPG